MKDFFAIHRAHIRLGEGCHRNSPAFTRDKFHFKILLIRIAMNHCANIALFESEFLQIPNQNHGIKFSYHFCAPIRTKQLGMP